MQDKPLNVTYVQMDHGRYAHFNGWIECISKYLDHIQFARNEVFITINVDGIPLYNDGRNNHAFPILVRLCTDPLHKLFCAGVYVSEDSKCNKMPHVDVFLDLFVKELLRVSQEGIQISNKCIKLCIKAFVCDAPARADLKRIVGHAGYWSCERCTQKGVTAGGHVALLNSYAPKRTDVSFLSKCQSEHHKVGPIPHIAKLKVGMVSSFVLDYMHLCCIGIMKRLLGRWNSSKKAQTKCHLSVAQKELLEKQLQTYSLHVPSEFKRKLSSGFRNFKFWKATELRQFLLYAGIAILQEILPLKLFINYLHFAISMRILLSEDQEENMDNVSFLLKKFVSRARKLYGDGFVSYNVHSLIHLPDDYCNFGPLDNVSCFPFENYLGVYIKGRLTGHNKPLEQICRHVNNENSKFSVNNLDHQDTPNHFYFKNTKFTKQSCASQDNCIITDTRKIGYITGFSHDKVTMVGFNYVSLFSKPCNSQEVGIYKLVNEQEVTRLYKKEIFSKIMILPQKNFWVAIQLLN